VGCITKIEFDIMETSVLKNTEHTEGKVAKAIEKQTAKLPSDVFLWASVGAMVTSLTLKVFRQNHLALFIGQWAAPFLLLGIYNKIVKVEGHDQEDRGTSGSNAM
jgi:hypothetical protein